MSARQQIEEALKANPSIALAELKTQLPDLKPTTLSTDGLFDIWWIANASANRTPKECSD